MKKVLFILVATLVLSSCQKGPKTAFVKTETIFKEYKGIKDQEEIFKKQQEIFTKKYDSLVKVWQKEVMDFQQKVKKMSPQQAKKKDQELYQKQQLLQQMQQQEGAKLTADMQKKTDSVIKEVYDFFEKYGNENGYEYIYGKNNTGALMYGKADKDITDQVLKALNTEYETQKK